MHIHPTTKKKILNPLARVSRAIDVGIANGCKRLAVVVARRPYRTLSICVGLVMCCTIGWIELDNESDVEKLYTPQRTRAFRDRDWVEDRFGDEDAAVEVFLDGNTNLLEKEALLEAMDLYDLVLGLESFGGTEGFDERSCAKVYWGGPPACQKESVLALWDYNRTTLSADNDTVGTVNAGIGTTPDCCSPTSRFFDLEAVASKLEYEDDRIVRAGALKFVFYLTQDLHRKSREDPKVIRLENKFERRLRNGDWEHFKKPLPKTDYGLERNSSAATDYDSVFINLAFVIIISYAFLALYERDDDAKSRGLLGLGAVLAVILSTAAAFGLVIAFGGVFSPSTGVAIFLVLGIGLDDSFVITGTVDEPYLVEGDELQDPLEDDARRVLAGASIEDVAGRRVVAALESSGPSITVTSFTDALAFVAGSFTDTPDIASFNRFCAASVFVDYLMQLTFFVALFALDQRAKLRRRVAARAGGAEPKKKSCWARVKKNQVAEGVSMVDVAPPPADDEEKGKPPVEEGEEEEEGQSGLTTTPRSFWGDVYPSLLLSPLGKVLVLASVGTLLAVSIVGASRVQMDIEENWQIVGGFEQKVLDFEKKHFSDKATTWVGLYTKTGSAEKYYSSRDDLRNVLAEYSAENYVVTESLDTNWFTAHEQWLSDRTINASADAWFASLVEFLAGDGIDYSEKVVLGEDEILATEIDSFWEAKGVTGADEKRRMRKARKAVRRASGDLGTVIVYNQGFIWNESFVRIARSTIFAMAVACITVLVVLLLLLGNVPAAMLVASSVALTCLSTLAAVYWYGDAVNYITSFFIVIAVGLSTDAPAHVCKAYLDRRDPTREERVTNALARLGPSVFRGGLSTILALAICGACITYIFQAFFRYLLTILVLALYSGLAVIPVVCSLIGPMPTAPNGANGGMGGGTTSLSPGGAEEERRPLS
ncbi:hypothetical protein CTAYLR_001393 [Chrysophaeum taylorii]|uniref:SSD domain-containing protein n=1 Tax=Chrysophaeum taylorii TaxID=2483200 RepID=A0AAD7XGM4_9STRA|nr:hypothetical protein CTAYLR_001393 [Chrysophaeum taylorii]